MHPKIQRCTQVNLQTAAQSLQPKSNKDKPDLKNISRVKELFLTVVKDLIRGALSFRV
jgi:hypothetical protein